MVHVDLVLPPWKLTTMRTAILLAAFLPLFVAAHPVRAQEPDPPVAAGDPDARAESPYVPSFTLNGDRASFAWKSLRTLGLDRDELIVSLLEWIVVLDRAPSYDLWIDEDEPGRLYLDVAGERRVIGVSTGSSYETVDGKSESVHYDGSAGLTEEQLREVRGITLEAGCPGPPAERIDRIDPERCFFAVEWNLPQDPVVPALPTGVRFLSINAVNSDDPVSPLLESFTSLLFLRFGGGSEERFDPAVLRCEGLRYLDITGESISSPDALGKLHELRSLDLSFCDGVTDVEFVRSLEELRQLLLWETEVTDLGPIGTLSRIDSVDARSTPVSRLPESVPSLEELILIGSAVTDEAAAVFRESNRHCRVLHGWSEALRESLAGADRLRVRSGGTCHRDPSEERTLFEIEDRVAVQAIVARIGLLESGGGGHCMCCGEPTLEFRRGDELVVALGFHHGVSVRWAEGPWPSDARLTRASALSLCEFLAEHGVDGPMREFREQTAARSAAEERRERYQQLLPESVTALLSSAESDADAMHAFIVGVPEKKPRIALALRLIGSDDAPWNRWFFLDGIVIALLSNGKPGRFAGTSGPADLEDGQKITALDIETVVLENDDDPQLLRGAARWYFSRRKMDSLSVAGHARVLRLVGAQALSHPSDWNRRETLYDLGQSTDAVATELLRDVLAGRFTPRRPERTADEWPGSVSQFGGSDEEIPDDCSDQVYAAYLLARREVLTARPAIEALVERTERPDELEVLRRALEFYDEGE